MIMMGHFRVLRAHNEWRVGHEFHTEVSSRLERLVEMGFLECLGGTATVAPIPATRRQRRGVQIRPE